MSIINYMSIFLVANWKMNLSRSEGISLIKRISAFLKESSYNETISIAIAPPATMLGEMEQIIYESGIKLAAQDCSSKDNGAHTGEISARALREYGCEYVILGHSERREYQMETSELISKKADLACRNDCLPIICIGETAKERVRGCALDIITKQLSTSLPDIIDEERLVVAYEPVWAIGSGKQPTNDQIQEVVELIWQVARSKYPSLRKENLNILYGGSVTPENCKELLRTGLVGGLLVGGASLVYDKFVKIIEIVFEENKILA